MAKKTILHDEHLRLSARIIDFEGWDLPVMYSGINDEHNAVRKKAGVFDIGHMGIFYIYGKNALEFLQMVTTNDVSKLSTGQSQYSLICNEHGGVIDDIILYRHTDKYMMIANASNTEKVLYWLNKNNKEDVTIEQKNDTLSMIALQGPKAEELLCRIIEADLSLLKKFHFVQSNIMGKKAIISRTGYTGEDGFEIISKRKDTPIIWKYLIQNGAQPCGLGARDTLRVEAGMPLYGHELGEDKNPLMMHLKFAVKMDKDHFIGKNAILSDNNIDAVTLVGIEMKNKAIPRHGYEIKEGGTITSGTYSPFLKKPIAIAYIKKELSTEGTNVNIIIRGKEHPATVTKLPFYKRSK